MFEVHVLELIVSDAPRARMATRRWKNIAWFDAEGMGASGEVRPVLEREITVRLGKKGQFSTASLHDGCRAGDDQDNLRIDGGWRRCGRWSRGHRHNRRESRYTMVGW